MAYGWEDNDNLSKKNALVPFTYICLTSLNLHVRLAYIYSCIQVTTTQMHIHVRMYTHNTHARTHTQIVQSCTCIHCTCTYRIHTSVHNTYDFSSCIPQIDNAALIKVDFPVSLVPLQPLSGSQKTWW